MRVPFVESNKIYLENKEEILGALDRVFSRGEFVLGNYQSDIVELEKWFADYIGVKHAIMVGAGTQALYLAYKALGIGPGDEIITVGHTFSATFDQIVAVGATPVLVDVDPETGLMDPKEVEKAITSKTRAIVPVHLEGKVANMDDIKEITLKYRSIFVVEDAAQAVGADWGGYGKAGSFGHIGCFSLYWAKIFGTFGNAGMLTTNDDELAYKLSNLRANWRFEKDPAKVQYGMNFEPDNAWAAVLNVRKKYLPDYLKRREEIAQTYLRNLRELEYRGLIKLPYEQEGRVWQDFVIRVHNPKDKEELLAHLDKHEIGYLGADPTQLYYPDFPLLNLPQLPHTKKYIQEQIRIPCNPYLTDGQVQFVIASLKAFWDSEK